MWRQTKKEILLKH